MEKKLKDTIYFLLESLSECPEHLQGKKKLAKLLYFVDFYSYKDRNKVIATDHYKAWDMGPVPSDFYSILDLLESQGVIKSKKIIFSGRNDKVYTSDVYKINKQMEISLTQEEEKFIRIIFDKFKRKNGKELQDLSHSQAPWNSVDKDEDIPIETAHLLPNLDSI